MKVAMFPLGGPSTMGVLGMPLSPEFLEMTGAPLGGGGDGIGGEKIADNGEFIVLSVAVVWS